MEVANTLAYCLATITAVKSFIVPAPGFKEKYKLTFVRSLSL
jgi:hypothetical protein